MAGCGPEFSYSLNPTLDDALEAARARHAGEPGVKFNLGPVSMPEAYREATAWAAEKLAADDTFGAWQRYEPALGEIPTKLTDLQLRDGPERLAALKAAFDTIVEYEEATSGADSGLAESMRLVLIPWQAFYDYHEHGPIGWLSELRVLQADKVRDVIDAEFMTTRKPAALYLNPLAPMVVVRRTPTSEWLTAQQYLQFRIEQDGPWGLMLTQAGSGPGIIDWVEKSADKLTQNGDARLRLGDHNVDSMGIFEWLALTLQVPPADLISGDTTMLLANRFDRGQATHVARAHVLPASSRSQAQTDATVDTIEAGRRGQRITPRITVIPHAGPASSSSQPGQK